MLVVVLSYRAGHKESSASLADVSAVEACVDALSGQIIDLRKSVNAVAKKKTAAPATTAASKKLSVCLTQIQREVDDLQAFSCLPHPAAQGPGVGVLPQADAPTLQR